MYVFQVKVNQHTVATPCGSDHVNTRLLPQDANECTTCGSYHVNTQ